MDENMKVIVFQLKDQNFGVDVQQIMSIETLQNMIEVPKTSDLVKGTINLRGENTPIIDLMERLDLGRTTYKENTRILIVSLKDLQIGIIVDSVTDIIDIDPSIIEPHPKIVGGVVDDFLPGVAKLDHQLLVLLDLEHLLNLEEIKEIQKAMENN